MFLSCSVSKENDRTSQGLDEYDWWKAKILDDHWSLSSTSSSVSFGTEKSRFSLFFLVSFKNSADCFNFQQGRWSRGDLSRKLGMGNENEKWRGKCARYDWSGGDKGWIYYILVKYFVTKSCRNFFKKELWSSPQAAVRKIFLKGESRDLRLVLNYVIFEKTLHFLLKRVS